MVVRSISELTQSYAMIPTAVESNIEVVEHANQARPCFRRCGMLSLTDVGKRSRIKVIDKQSAEDYFWGTLKQAFRIPGRGDTFSKPKKIELVIIY